MNCDAQLINNLGRSENEVKMAEFFAPRHPELALQKARARRWRIPTHSHPNTLALQREPLQRGERSPTVITF